MKLSHESVPILPISREEASSVNLIDSAQVVISSEPEPRYQGGFSTSICSIFSDPSRRSECCSLACCGVLASDRTRYLLLGKRPNSWLCRLLLNMVLPLGLYLASRSVSRSIEKDVTAVECATAFPDDGSGPYLEALNHTSDYHDSKSASYIPGIDPKDEAYDDRWAVVLCLYLSLAVVSVILLRRASAHRLAFRRLVVDRLAERDGGETEGGMGNCGTGAIRTWGCFGAPDGNVHRSRKQEGDLCSCIWSFLSNVCCLTCCQCWCQCCGMCAVGQEAREVDAIVSEEDKFIDYITFQPYVEYWPGLERLRLSGENSMKSHFAALSEFSSGIVRYSLFAVACTVPFAFVNFTSFSITNVGILLATLAQSFFILYLVHWRWNRFDVSLDAVIKCFASGFVLSTSSALIVEVLISAVMYICFALLVVVGFILAFFLRIDFDALAENDFAALNPEMVSLSVLKMFLEGFVVAALTEELCKYFGYWMVDHPDFLDDARQDRLRESLSGRETAALEGVRVGDADQTLPSRGGGITVAMVSAAVGFSCCENLEYIFASDRANVQILTLLLRSAFPVHAIAAAIQSLGVCQRNLEGDASTRLGRIILPALLLHGAFDFFLMVGPVLVQARHLGDDDDGAVQAQSDSLYNTYLGTCRDYVDVNIWAEKIISMENQDLIITGVCMGLSVLSLVVGCIYYSVNSRRQKERLEILQSFGSSEASEPRATLA